TSLIILFTLPFSIAFGRILINMGFNDISLFQGTMINLATLILTAMAMGYFWRAMYKRNGEKVKHVITKQSLQTYHVKFFPKKKGEYFKMVLYWIASLLFTVMGIALLLIEGVLIGFIWFVLF